MFVIDGTQWNYPFDLERTSNMQESGVSGLMLDGSYYADIEGTFYTYSVSIAVPLTDRQAYNTIRNLLTDPIGEHTFVFPDESGTIEIVGRIGSVSDVYVRLPNGESYWRGVSFDVTANHPTRQYNMSQITERGRTFFPDAAEHNEGDSWVWTNGRWELSASYNNADTTKY